MFIQQAMCQKCRENDKWLGEIVDFLNSPVYGFSFRKLFN